MRKSLTIIFLLAPFLLFAEGTTIRERILNLRLEFYLDKNDQVSNDLIKVVELCQQSLNKYFSKVNQATPKLHVMLEGTPPSKDFFNLVYFKRNELIQLSEYELLDAIMSKMIWRTLVGLGSDKAIKPPAWLVAAHVFNLKLQDNLSTEEKYPATRMSIVGNKFPNIDNLLDGEGVSPTNYWIYRIYAEHCSVFLAAIRKIPESRKKLFSIYTSYEGKTITDLFAKNFDELGSRITRQRWFNAACTKVCFHILNPYPPEVIHKKINDLFSVASARPGSNSMNRIPLEKIFADEDQKLNYAVIGFIEKDFYDVKLTAPELLRPAINGFIRALRSLKKDEREDFVEEITEARAKLKERVIILNNFIMLADKLEAELTNVSENYREILRAHQYSKARQRRLFPEWDNYLNELERKLENTVIK